MTSRGGRPLRRWQGGRGLALLGVVFVVAAVAEVAIGPIGMSPWKAVAESIAWLHGSRTTDAVVMGAIRWPRMAVASLVGAGLASTGAVLQAVFRNPMADPSIIGVSSGGALGAIIIVQTGLAAVSIWLTPLAAFVGALVTVVLIYRLATVRGRTAIYSLLLVGVAIGSLFGAMITLILSLDPLQTMQQIFFWLMGGLDGSTWTNAGIVGVFAVLGLLVYMGQADALDILSIGEDQAEGVGVSPQHVKRIVFLTAAVVVGACVSVSGVIAFVGLIVPHLIRLWMGPRHRFLIPASALGGAVLVLLSDIVARMVLLPAELNIGIVTSALGAPFFLYLLRRRYVAMERR